MLLCYACNFVFLPYEWNEKQKKTTLVFLYIYKIWQILTRLSRALSWAQTSYFWRVISSGRNYFFVEKIGLDAITLKSRIGWSTGRNVGIQCQDMISSSLIRIQAWSWHRYLAESNPDDRWSKGERSLANCYLAVGQSCIHHSDSKHLKIEEVKCIVFCN